MQTETYDQMIAKGQADALKLTTEHLRSCLTVAQLNDRVERYAVAQIAASDAWSAGMAAFDRQRTIDTLHARAIGVCPGCARAADLRWAHRLNCATACAPGSAGQSVVAGSAGDEVIVLD